MGFQPVDFAHLARFNSAVSSEFLDTYNKHIDAKIAAERSEPAHRTFAPSSFRCDRRSWFRIRGVELDKAPSSDRTLRFVADVGTACHRIIQTNLKEALGDCWIDVGVYLQNQDVDYEYILTYPADSLETQIEVLKPPIRFACDGIVKCGDVYYLLEIKTSEFGSWNELLDPKREHVDQAKMYATMLGLSNVLFLYMDRQYGELKCYEIHVSDTDKQEIWDRMNKVMEFAEYGVAPDALPKGDKWCTPQMCPYFKKCAEYGR